MVDRRLSVGRGQYLPQAQVKSLKTFLELVRIMLRWVFHSLVVTMDMRAVVEGALGRGEEYMECPG